jgi:methyl-accepting chemotaxis protein
MLSLEKSMKLTIGLLIFMCVTTITVHLAVTKRIDGKLTIIFLAFAIVAGFVAANYDVVKRLKLNREGLEVETAKREIDEAKSTALSEIDTEVKSQKESIRLLISTANETSDKLEEQRKALSDLIATASALQKRIEEQKQEISKLNQGSQAAKQEIAKLNAASSQIALTLIRATYLSLETKNELGSGPRLKKAIDESLQDMNRILPMVIPDPQQRAQWVEQLQNTLPKRE